MLFFALGFFYNSYYKEILGVQLVKRGIKIQAAVKEIEHKKLDMITPGGEIGQNVPSIVVANWKDNNNIEHTFRSKYLVNNPQPKLKPGDSVDVYINPKNVRRYFIDLGNLE